NSSLMTASNKPHDISIRKQNLRIHKIHVYWLASKTTTPGQLKAVTSCDHHRHLYVVYFVGTARVGNTDLKPPRPCGNVCASTSCTSKPPRASSFFASKVN